MIRFFDIVFSFFGLIILSPFFLILAVLIQTNSSGPVFYSQTRVGKNSNDFKLFKFRSMKIDSDQKGLLTVNEDDTRITRIGFFIRKYKFDELPQLYNVLLGEMSLVGPRPEVRKYVNYYSEKQSRILSVRPGITDYASIQFANENKLLAHSINPEKVYIEEIMPSKIELNMKYIENPTIYQYFNILYLTFLRILH